MEGNRGLTKALIEALEGPLNVKKRCYEQEIFTEFASMNKVRLEFLRALDIQGSLRDFDERRLARVVKTVEEISKAFKDIDYAFYKLLKPIVYVPADIDILIASKHISEAVSKLKSLGFRVEVYEPYCITLTKGIIVDLYTNPSLGNIVYLKGSKLLEHVDEAEFYGLFIPSLERPIEALASAAHAIYKERLYTLNDYFTVSRWTTNKTLKVAAELKVMEAIEISRRINRGFIEGFLEAPYRIGMTTWVGTWIKKMMDDPETRASALNILKVLTSRRAGPQLKSKLFRRTY